VRWIKKTKMSDGKENENGDEKNEGENERKKQMGGGREKKYNGWFQQIPGNKHDHNIINGMGVLVLVRKWELSIDTQVGLLRSLSLNSSRILSRTYAQIN